MSNNRTKKAWRQFEELVALVESHLAPKGAIIRSPDKIRDNTTGNLREVDASIRYKVGSIPILITIECRDRSDTEDVTWIEQLIAKRDSINASVTVAVSSKGFSLPAITKARTNNIETRLLRDVSEQAIRDWAQNIQIIIISGEFSMGPPRLKFKPHSENAVPVIHSRVRQEFSKGDVEYKFIRRIADGQMISIGDLLRDEERRAGNPIFDHRNRNVKVKLPPQTQGAIPISSSFPKLFEDVQVGEPPITKNLNICFDTNEATVETDLGHAEVESLDVELLVWRRAYPSQIGRLLSYEDSNEKQITLIEDRDIPLSDGKSIRVIIS